MKVIKLAPCKFKQILADEFNINYHEGTTKTLISGTLGETSNGYPSSSPPLNGYHVDQTDLDFLDLIIPDKSGDGPDWAEFVENALWQREGVDEISREQCSSLKGGSTVLEICQNINNMLSDGCILDISTTSESPKIYNVCPGTTGRYEIWKRLRKIMAMRLLEYEVDFQDLVGVFMLFRITVLLARIHYPAMHRKFVLGFPRSPSIIMFEFFDLRFIQPNPGETRQHKVSRQARCSELRFRSFHH